MERRTDEQRAAELGMTLEQFQSIMGYEHSEAGECYPDGNKMCRKDPAEAEDEEVEAGHCGASNCHPEHSAMMYEDKEDAMCEHCGAVHDNEAEAMHCMEKAAKDDYAKAEKTYQPPAGAAGNARKVLKWKKEKGSEVKGMTPVGWARARQLASGKPISAKTVKRMSAFNRHRKNAVVDPKYKGEPWKDRGYVAWLGWGGTTGIDWAIRTSKSMDKKRSKSAIEEALAAMKKCPECGAMMQKGRCLECAEKTQADNCHCGQPAKVGLKKCKDCMVEMDSTKAAAPKTGKRTPAPKKDQKKGSKKNKPDSAKDEKGKINFSAETEKRLASKVKEHNAKVEKSGKGHKASLGALKAVYRRGAGAYSTSHAPGMSRDGWAMARVAAFLHLLRTGTPKNSKYTQDNDLLPKGHPKSSK